MGWVFYSLICLFVSTAYRVFNQHYKIEASILMLYRGLGTALLLLPVFILLPMQKNIEFYYYSILMGVFISYLDSAYQNGVAKYGAGPISRVTPLYIIFSLFIWWIINPLDFFDLLQNKIKLFGIIFSIFIVVVALFYMRKDKISKETLKYCVGIYIASVLIDIFAKIMFLKSDGSLNAVLSYMFVSSFVVGIINLMYLLIKNRGNSKLIMNRAIDKKVMFAGFLAITFIILAMYTRNFAIIKVNNPAYVSTLISMSPVVIAIYNKIIGFDDKTNKFLGLLIVFACSILAICAK